MELSIWSHASIFHVDYSTTVLTELEGSSMCQNETKTSLVAQNWRSLKEKYEDRFQLKNSFL